MHAAGMLIAAPSRLAAGEYFDLHVKVPEAVRPLPARGAVNTRALRLHYGMDRNSAHRR